MEEMNLGNWGKIKTSPPNMATCFEMVISWTNCGEDLAQLARICSAAIGSISKERFPKYRPAIHKPGEYGHICLNLMLENGIDSGVILRTGTKVLEYMLLQLPKTEDVEDEADFLSEQPPEDFAG